MEWFGYKIGYFVNHARSLHYSLHSIVIYLITHYPIYKIIIFRALFPCGDNMVCIIDDREDVWRHALNLIHVRPYSFFQSTGDINAPPLLRKLLLISLVSHRPKIRPRNFGAVVSSTRRLIFRYQLSYHFQISYHFKAIYTCNPKKTPC